MGENSLHTIPFTKEELVRLYWQENKSQREIATIKTTTRKCIRWWMQKWAILRRSPNGQGFTGTLNRHWKGGRNNDGRYIRIWVYSSNPFFPMVKRSSPDTGYILEHRLVMAQHLDRCLQPWEVVHHKNGNKQDNRIENLELTTEGEHIKSHNKGYEDGYQKGYQDGQTSQIRELKEEIRLLRWEFKQLTEARN